MRQNAINCTHNFSTLQIFFTFLIWRAFSTWQFVMWRISPHVNLSCGESLQVTICHVEKFLHMADFFSTGTTRGAHDKYEVWQWQHQGRQGPSSQMLMLRRVPWPPESGCRKCRGPKKCLLNLKLPMSGFRSRPVYLKTSLTRNSFTQITGTPSKPELKARGAVTNLWATKVQTFPVLCKKYQAIVNSFI